MIVTGRHGGFPIHLVRPPADRRHAVLDGAGGNALILPARHQCVHVLGLQGTCRHATKAHLVQLVGNLREQIRSLRLGRPTAVAILVAELFELVIQVSHSAEPIGQ